MTPMTRETRRMGTVRGLTAVLAAMAVAAAVVAADTPPRKFYPDDPVLVDHDTLDVPDPPATITLSTLYDFFLHTFIDAGAPDPIEAPNANTLDEVPDSSWFTNRHGRRRLSLEALRRGPDTTPAGPDPDRPWRVVSGKTEGLTPGLQIVDAAGDRYVIKFDPLDVPELASAAEVIATKLFYAVGYHTPENYIVRVHPDRLEIAPGTTIENRAGRAQPLTPARLRGMLADVPRLPDGRMRVLASKFLPGRPLGPFRYHGTRSDDPNDVIPHEHRRELRGLRVFAAWTNHDDTRAQNTQDSWVEEDGRRYVRHYLLDFGSTFGSGSVGMQQPNLGFHYFLDVALIKKNVRGFGLHVPAYRRARWTTVDEHPAVGRWEAEVYEPHAWRSNYPNPAFVRMSDRDAFWAARILMTFTPDELRAIVETGEYSRPGDADLFLRVLIARQHKTAREYFDRLPPLDRFEVTGDGLAFTNLSELYGFATSGTTYETRWSVYDNATGLATPVGDAVTSVRTVVPIPAVPTVQDGVDRFLVVEIRAEHPAHPRWSRRVAVYLRPVGGAFAVVGIEREADPPRVER